jgi:hypothetical protein
MALFQKPEPFIRTAVRTSDPKEKEYKEWKCWYEVRKKYTEEQ